MAVGVKKKYVRKTKLLYSNMEGENPLHSFFEENREILNYKTLKFYGWVHKLPLPKIRCLDDNQNSSFTNSATKYPSFLNDKSDIYGRVREWKEFDTLVISRLQRLGTNVLRSVPAGVTPIDIKRFIQTGSTNVRTEQDVKAIFSKLICAPINSLLDSCDERLEKSVKARLTVTGAETDTRLKPDVSLTALCSNSNAPRLVGEIIPQWYSALNEPLEVITKHASSGVSTVTCMESITSWMLGDDKKKEIREKRELKQKCRYTLKAIEQTYTYMLINKTRFAFISSYQHTRFLKIENDSQGSQFLFISKPISPERVHSYTLIGAILIMCLEPLGFFPLSPPVSLPESVHNIYYFSGDRKKRSFIGSLQFSSHKKEEWYVSNLGSIIGHYIRGDFYPFSKNIRRGKNNNDDDEKHHDGEMGDADKLSSSPPLKVIVNICDTVNNSAQDIEVMEREHKLYKRLKPLQGILIPELIGYGILESGYARVLIIKAHLGTPISIEELQKDKKVMKECKRLLDGLHRLKICHGDLKPGSFVRMGENQLNDIRMVGFMHAICNADEDDIQFEQNEFSRFISSRNVLLEQDDDSTDRLTNNEIFNKVV